MQVYAIFETQSAFHPRDAARCPSGTGSVWVEQGAGQSTGSPQPWVGWEQRGKPARNAGAIQVKRSHKAKDDGAQAAATFFSSLWVQVGCFGAIGALMNIVLQPRPLLVLGLNVWMGTDAGADELVEIPYR